MPCSVSSLAVCSDGGDIAGGAELAAPVESRLQGAIEGGRGRGGVGAHSGAVGMVSRLGDATMVAN